MKCLLQILMVFMFISCKKEPHKDNSISDKFKLEFINEILSDSLNQRYSFKNKSLISNFPAMIPINPINDIQYPDIELNSVLKYISHYLKTKDTLFILQQIRQNKNFNFDQLSNYDYNLFDYKSCISNHIKLDSIYKLVAIECEKFSYKSKSSIIFVSTPIFNKELNLAFIRFRDIGGGESVIFEKKNNNWEFQQRIEIWHE